MGKGTDKLYITHSEWASDNAFSASAGAGVIKSKPVPGASFRRLPYNFCAVSLQPFEHPMCTSDGTIFDLTHILPWLKKHGTNPVNGKPLKSTDLIKLNFTKNDAGEYVDPVTFKAFTDNTHIVTLKVSGNVFAWDTIERLNLKAKNLRDLVSNDEFTRTDVVTLQDPTNLESRDLSSFKYLKDGVITLTEEEKRERNDPTSYLNMNTVGNAARILKAKEAVSKARAERAAGASTKSDGTSVVVANASANGKPKSMMSTPKVLPYNAAQYTSGKAAASFTSTGMTPYTSNERALLTDEEYMLKPKRVKQKGYARIQTTHGDLNIELQTEFAPKAVWNFIQLAKKGYYRDVPFHRNIKNFMIQGGDPTGTGRGGQSIWGKPFADEYAQSSLTHNARGILSMANKGRNSNTSQFFILYRAAPHLDRKHTIFGKIADAESTDDSMATLARLEGVETENDKPVEDCLIEDVIVFVDPFEEFRKSHNEKETTDREKAETELSNGHEEDHTTWTGKRIRAHGTVESGSVVLDVGKYLHSAAAPEDEIVEEVVEEWDMPMEPVTKKRKAGGFGNFDNW